MHFSISVSRAYLWYANQTNLAKKWYEMRMCISWLCLFKSEEILTTAEDSSKDNSKEKEVRSFALLVDQPIDCQQEEGKRSCRLFGNVTIRIIIIALLLVFLSFFFFWKSRRFYTCFFIACYCFSCNNLLRCCTWIIFGVEIVQFEQVL